MNQTKISISILLIAVIFLRKKCTAPLFSPVEPKLDVGLPPNHHVGNIPVIQFGEGLPVSALPGEAQTCRKRFMSL